MNKRVKLCAERVRESGLNAILVSNPVNITYITGFRPAEGYLLLTSNGNLTYFTNFLYQKEAEANKSWKSIISGGNIFALIAKEIVNTGLKKIGFEAKHLPLLEFRKINQYLIAKHLNFSVTIDLVENLRAIKEPVEIAFIRESAKISMEAFEFISEIIRPDMDEKIMSIEIEKFLKIKGDNALAFNPIVASGKNSALPHYIAGNDKLNSNILLIDLGSKHRGYCADLTRMFFWGKIPFLLRKITDIVRKAQETAIKKIRAGVKIKDVDSAARDFIEKKGYGKYFGHGVGHGVGLDVHEPPYINSRNEEILKEGMVVAIEPAIYINNRFGVRIEDMILVKADKAEILNKKCP